TISTSTQSRRLRLGSARMTAPCSLSAMTRVFSPTLGSRAGSTWREDCVARVLVSKRAPSVRLASQDEARGGISLRGGAGGDAGVREQSHGLVHDCRR